MSTNGDKLAALRAKYGTGRAGEIFDARFRTVAERIFSGDGTRLAPYAGVATLLGAPHMPLGLGDPAFSALQVALIGVPMDLGVTNRPGARFGPRALRGIERIGPYNHVLGCAPVFDLRVADVAMSRWPAATGWNNAMRTSTRISARWWTPGSFRWPWAVIIR